MVEYETTTIKQVVFIPAKPVQVYEAFVDEKKHSDFTGAKATYDPKVGGNSLHARALGGFYNKCLLFPCFKY